MPITEFENSTPAQISSSFCDFHMILLSSDVKYLPSMMYILFSFQQLERKPGCGFSYLDNIPAALSYEVSNQLRQFSHKVPCQFQHISTACTDDQQKCIIFIQSTGVTRSAGYLLAFHLVQLFTFSYYYMKLLS